MVGNSNFDPVVYGMRYYSSWKSRYLVSISGLALLLSLSLAAVRISAESTPIAGKASPRLVIDFGDGVEKHFKELKWVEEATVLDLLRQADAHSRGIDLVYVGRGTTAFVTQIDDLKAQGFGGDKRNWIFFVNGKPADRGCGVFRVRRGDEIRWRFLDKLPEPD